MQGTCLLQLRALEIGVAGLSALSFPSYRSVPLRVELLVEVSSFGIGRCPCSVCYGMLGCMERVYAHRTYARICSQAGSHLHVNSSIHMISYACLAVSNIFIRKAASYTVILKA
jgi:hypothetical protein